MVHVTGGTIVIRNNFAKCWSVTPQPGGEVVGGLDVPT
jgi:hypothetical protein